MKCILPGILILFAALCCDAAEIGRFDIPDHRDGMPLVGAGVLKKGYIFNIYAGALYAADAGDADPRLSRVRKRLDIYYYHRTPKKHMIRAAEKSLEQNLDAERLALIRPHIEQLHNAYRDGKKGAMASLAHQPGEGLTYLFNNQPILTIASDEFADAYFTIWLGEYPSSPTMKVSLLGLDQRK